MYVHQEDRRKVLLVGLALLLIVVLAAAGWLWLRKPEQPPVYGAIALSRTSLGFGTAWGYSDPDAAFQRAQRECAHAGASDCAVRVNLAGTCGALAVSTEKNANFAVTDASRDGAGALALAQCQASGASDCVVETNFCGSGSNS